MLLSVGLGWRPLGHPIRHAVAKRTLSHLATFVWWRVVHWVMHGNRRTCKAIRGRRLRTDPARARILNPERRSFHRSGARYANQLLRHAAIGEVQRELGDPTK